MGRKLDQTTKDTIVRRNLEEGISTRVLAKDMGLAAQLFRVVFESTG